MTLTHGKKLKRRKGAWFAPVRGSYLPVSWQGWLTYIPFVGYLALSALVASRYAHGTIQAILWIVPNWVAATVVMTWIARGTS